MSIIDKLKGMLVGHSDTASGTAERPGDPFAQHPGASKVDMAQGKTKEFIDRQNTQPPER
ncbi:antitoxin [Streptomyces sp. NPDC059861]|uniref:antitoxin n=1 Tax=Streptomyces sp. NPDC059861 TaxID=3346974 RepID=UPI003657AA2B